MLQTIIGQLITGLKATTLPEYIAVFAGIISVWFSRKENILLYPVGLISTTIYIWLSFKYHLFGEASVNFYYTVVSIWGWWLWAQKDVSHNNRLHITFSNKEEWLQHITFFLFFFVAIYMALTYLKKEFAEGAIPWADAFASATAYTGMWLMAKKKVESWWWWLVTNIASIPLYFVKGLVFTSVYYTVLFVMAIAGLITWQQKARLNTNRRICA
jgi:nicotinamide mononucleotide transporter